MLSAALTSHRGICVRLQLQTLLSVWAGGKEELGLPVVSPAACSGKGR